MATQPREHDYLHELHLFQNLMVEAGIEEPIKILLSPSDWLKAGALLRGYIGPRELTASVPGGPLDTFAVRRLIFTCSRSDDVPVERVPEWGYVNTSRNGKN